MPSADNLPWSDDTTVLASNVSTPNLSAPMTTVDNVHHKSLTLLNQGRVQHSIANNDDLDDASSDDDDDDFIFDDD